MNRDSRIVVCVFPMGKQWKKKKGGGEFPNCTLSSSDLFIIDILVTYGSFYVTKYTPLNQSVHWFIMLCISYLSNFGSFPVMTMSSLHPFLLTLMLIRRFSHFTEESSSMEGLPPQQRKPTHPCASDCPKCTLHTFSECWNTCWKCQNCPMENYEYNLKQEKRTQDFFPFQAVTKQKSQRAIFPEWENAWIFPGK